MDTYSFQVGGFAEGTKQNRPTLTGRAVHLTFLNYAVALASMKR